MPEPVDPVFDPDRNPDGTLVDGGENCEEEDLVDGICPAEEVSDPEIVPIDREVITEEED